LYILSIYLTSRLSRLRLPPQPSTRSRRLRLHLRVNLSHWKDKTTRRHPVRRACTCVCVCVLCTLYTLRIYRYTRGHVRAFIIITTIMNALGRPLTRSASLTFVILLPARRGKLTVTLATKVYNMLTYNNMCIRIIIIISRAPESRESRITSYTMYTFIFAFIMCCFHSYANG